MGWEAAVQDAMEDCLVGVLLAAQTCLLFYQVNLVGDVLLMLVNPTEKM